MAIGIPLLLVLVCFLATLGSKWGRHVDPSFFEVMAGALLPVILIAETLEWESVARELRERAGDDPGRGFILGWSATSGGILFLIGEALAVWAVADGTQTSFLAATVSICVLVLTADLLSNVHARVKGDLSFVDSLLPSKTGRGKRRSR